LRVRAGDDDGDEGQAHARVKEDLVPLHRIGQVVCVPGEWAWNALCLVVIVESGEAPPRRTLAGQLDDSLLCNTRPRTCGKGVQCQRHTRLSATGA
jgi:hypothetical protein